MSELALQLIEENKRTKDTFLDLGNCDLMDNLPRELGECVWLERLNLGDLYYDPDQNKWLGSENDKPYNHINGQSLTILKKLTKLQSLSLDDNQIEDYSLLLNLTQLKYLELSSNKIKDVELLQNFTHLQHLDLGRNQILNAGFLQSLTQLRYLRLGSNTIHDINFLQNLTQLQHLDLGSNPIQDYSPLQNLTQLTYLNLSSNGIQDISFLQNLTQLQTLNLSSNQILDISFLQNLTQLRYLNISLNGIQDISFLQNLTQLQTLHLSTNQIQNYSFLQNLTQLHALYLGANPIQDYSFLQNLTQLQTLNLSANIIEDYSYIYNLTQLQHLDLRNSRIRDIKPLLPLFKNGLEPNLKQHGNKGILLFDNPIINPPIEIVEQGREAILRYFDRIEEQGKDYIFEAKLTLVGDGGSGKTSLQRRILDEKAELPAGSDRTRGIRVYDWSFNDAHGKNYISHIWDFGGQDVYYPVHRFFLTQNSVYILIASTRFSVHNFEYWIPTIYQFGGNSPIILVQTCDNGNQKDWIDIKPFYGISEYNLKPIYKIDLTTADNWGLKNLKGFIQHQITELPHIGKAVPKSWVKVREQLIEKANTHDYISFEKYSELCQATDKEAFREDVDIEDLARFLHDLGIILWYYNKDLLRNLVILKPEWAMNAVYKIIDDTTIQSQKGIIYQADFIRLWKEETYRTKIRELKLMLQVFKIAFPKQHQKQDFLLPARLLLMPEDELWPNNENSLRLEYHFDFMPRGIINQLSADLSNKILSDETVWSDAVILKHEGSSAQIVEETHKKKIMIKAKGHDARGLMVLIMNSISNIIDEYRGVVPLIRVPCNCNMCQSLEKPSIFEYEKLMAWITNGRDTLTCNESDTKLSIFQLLYSIGLDKFEIISKIHSQDDLIVDVPSPIPTKIFVTYSWTDKDSNIDEAHHTKVHQLVNALNDRGFETTFDKEINDHEASTNFTKMMVQNIEKNDKVIIILSEGYVVKANDFKSSVGFEYSLILNDIDVNTNKYLLVTFSDRTKDIYPFALRNRDTIDLSKNDPKEIDRLLRKLEGSPSVNMQPKGKRVSLEKLKDVGKLF